ncbi:EAL domain-containing protein [Paenibacillus sp. RS8]|uniref:EAL domain-containing protein n=1 Tax=Paenibacillus sp. RS8 TaxID=3242681 RepID=UPI0035C0C324
MNVACNHCVVRELNFEIKAHGEHNLRILPEVIHHLSRSNTIHKVEKNVITIKEAGVRDFLDFCNDHMESEQFEFRIDDQTWRPLSELPTVLNMEWIDEVITKGLVTCHFQPIVNVREEIFAYELLSRFKKEDGSLIYPNEIFAAARNRGRLYALDRLCRMTAVKYAAPLNKKTFINFIPTSIYTPEFCLRSTVELANQLGVDPSLFVFEVVETEKVDDLAHLKAILTYYKDRGFEYALDDVGEGFSTIEMLLELKPHYMKLDMKYVQGVSSDLNKQKIAKQFLQKALEIQSVPLAEGVEFREDFEWLKQSGYQLFQGYLFGKPDPIPKQ